MTGTPARRVEDELPLHAAVEWKWGALCLLGAAASVVVFGVRPTFDVNAPGFNPLVVVPLLLAGYGTAQIGRALFGRVRGRRFGASALDLHQHTVRAGQTLEGRIVTARDLVAADGFLLRLRCIERRRIGDASGAAYRDDDRILWEAAQVVRAARSRTDGIPVSFAIPPDAAAGSAGHPLHWTLEVEASVEGARYDAVFTVPVTDPRDDDGTGDEDPGA